MTIPDGIHPGLPAEDYHADPALGSSSVKLMLESPKQYRHNADHPKQASRGMDVGSLIHALLLEPDTVAEVYAVLDDGITLNWAQSAFQGWYREAFRFAGCQGMKVREAADGFRQHYSESGRTIVRAGDWTTAQRAAAAVRDDSVASSLLTGRLECSAFVTLDVVRCKARADALPDEGELHVATRTLSLSDCIVDLKTTGTKAKAGEWTGRVMQRMGNHIQAGHYRRAFREAGEAREWWAFVVVEQNPPHHVGVFVMDRDTLRTGEALSRRACADWAMCTEADQWPGYGEGVQIIGIGPDWLDGLNERAQREVRIDVI